jgi:hypothetical protein
MAGVFLSGATKCVIRYSKKTPRFGFTTTSCTGSMDLQFAIALAMSAGSDMESYTARTGRQRLTTSASTLDRKGESALGFVTVDK